MGGARFDTDVSEWCRDFGKLTPAGTGLGSRGHDLDTAAISDPPLLPAHTGDLRIEQDHYFHDTARCIEWFVQHAIQAAVNAFVLDGNLTTYKQTIEERKCWVDTLIRMAEHTPVLLVAGNHGKELEGDLYPLVKVKGKHPLYLSRNQSFSKLAGRWLRLSLTHGRRNSSARLKSGVSWMRLPNNWRSSMSASMGRCAEFPLEPLLRLEAQYVGLSHVHLWQQLAPRVWYAGSLSRCDYSETEEKGYHLVTLTESEIRSDLSDLQIDFRLSPTCRMVELYTLYENGEFHFSEPVDSSNLQNSRVKVVVTVGSGIHEALSREKQAELREQLLAANPAELKVKIEHAAETATETAPLSVANSAEEKLRAYWGLKGSPPADQQERLLARLNQVEQTVLAQIE